MKLPARLVESPVDSASGRDWLAELPTQIARINERWGLIAGPPFEPGGTDSWVAPAVTRDGQDAVLKVSQVHVESMDEAAGLRAWAGSGAVEVYAAETVDDCMFLLLESCQLGYDLNSLAPSARDEVIAGLLSRLWLISPGVEFRALAEMCEAWAEETAELLAARPGAMDPALARDGLAAFRELARPRPDDVVLCTDLHAGNVLASTREPWLVIDPKPYVGDRHYDPLQHMLNEERLLVDPLGLVHRMADLCNLDRNRLRQWMFARCVQEGVASPDLQSVARSLAD